MSKRIAIIAGAGPAGLTAAYELLKRTDMIPIVLEMTGAIGGIAQTYNYKGNRIDIGGHRFVSNEQRVMDWWFALLPPQGASAAGAAEADDDRAYAAEVMVEYLCRNCAPTPSPGPSPMGEGSPKGGEGAFTVKRKAPDPATEDRVMLQRKRVSRIFTRRSFFPYPIDMTVAVARRLGFRNTFLITLSYLKRRIRPLRDETFLDAFYRNRFGDRLYATFFKDYTEKVWGVPCNQIRTDWSVPHVQGLSLKRAVTHAVRDLLRTSFQKAQAEREVSRTTRFWYPKFGPGQMWELVAERIQACGGEVRLHHRVCGVHIEAGRVHDVSVEDVATGDIKRIACDAFFSTMPIKHFIPMITPRAPVSVIEVAEGLRYRDFLTVGLLMKKLYVQEQGKPPLERIPDQWIYVQDSEVRVGHIQIFNNWSPSLVANPTGTVWIGLEYFVDEGGDLWVKPDSELIAMGIAELEKIGFLKHEDVLDSCVLRMPKAYPAYFGSYDQLKAVQDFVNRVPNLYLIGRNGLHRSGNQDHSMLTAMMAVDNIVAGKRDSSNIWEVNQQRASPEEHSKTAEKVSS